MLLSLSEQAGKFISEGEIMRDGMWATLTVLLFGSVLFEYYASGAFKECVSFFNQALGFVDPPAQGEEIMQQTQGTAAIFEEPEETMRDFVWITETTLTRGSVHRGLRIGWNHPTGERWATVAGWQDHRRRRLVLIPDWSPKKKISRSFTEGRRFLVESRSLQRPAYPN